jgi:hypothetical protein
MGERVRNFACLSAFPGPAKSACGPKSGLGRHAGITVAATTRRAKHLRFSRRACQARSAKIFVFPKHGTYDLTKTSRAPQEGAARDRHDSLARDAMDAFGPQDVRRIAYGQAVRYECRRFEVPEVPAASSYRDFKSKAALEPNIWLAPFAFRSSQSECRDNGELRKAGAGSLRRWGQACGRSASDGS